MILQSMNENATTLSWEIVNDCQLAESEAESYFINFLYFL